MQKTYKRYAAIFILPTLIAFAMAFVIPFILGLGLSLMSWRGSILKAKWSGFNNYVLAFQDPFFKKAFYFTVLFTIISIITINVLAFTLALLLTRGRRGSNFFRTVFFMPNLIGGIVLGYIWQVIINSTLNQFGLTMTMNAKYGFWGLVILMNWQLIGYMMIIFIAGIQSIPVDLIDAAKVDGANSWQRLKYVIIPAVMPSITITLFLTLTNSFKLYDQNLALTNGGPARQTEMLAYNIVYTVYNQRLPGVGQAKAVIFFILVALIALTQVSLTRRKEIEG